MFLGISKRVSIGICTAYPLVMHGFFAKMDAFLCGFGTGFPVSVAGLCAKSAWSLNPLLKLAQPRDTITARKDGGVMDTTNNAAWEAMTPEQKRRELYDRQVATLKTFLEHGAITQAQHDKSLHDLTVKMGYGD